MLLSSNGSPPRTSGLSILLGDIGRSILPSVCTGTEAMVPLPGRRLAMLGRYRFTHFSIGNIPALFALLLFVFCVRAQTLEAQAFRETTATGDNPAEVRRPQDSLIVGVNLDAVSILVTARNTKGDYISSLKANDFQVLED